MNDPIVTLADLERVSDPNWKVPEIPMWWWNGTEYVNLGSGRRHVPAAQSLPDKAPDAR